MKDTIELAHTDEQRWLRDHFRSSHLSFAYKSKACPACCPQMAERGEEIKGWERGTSVEYPCKDVGALKCNNCGFVKTFTLRQSTCRLRSKPTPAQQRTIDRIKCFFENRMFGVGQPVELETFEVKPTDYGTFWVSVKTTGNVWSKRGGFFHVKRGGRATCETVYDLLGSDLSEQTKEHYTSMVN